MFSNKYHYILINYTYELLHRRQEHNLLVYYSSLMQLINGAQFLDITFIFLLSGAAAVPAFGNVIVPLKYIHASL